MAAGIALALMTAAPGRAQDDPTRDLAIDAAMGALDEDPVLIRILTTRPEPWPGPRFDARSEGIVLRDAEQAQDDFRELRFRLPRSGLTCTRVRSPFGGAPRVVCR